MKIIFNPSRPAGSDIKNFMHKGEFVESHPAGKQFQYDDKLADGILETFPFLRELTPTEAEEISKKPEKGEFECEFCDFTTKHKVALAGHRRSHKKELEESKKPQIDTTKVPIMDSKKVDRSAILDDDPTKDGVDKDGVEWVGGGAKETPPTMTKVPKEGRGHFVGGMLEK